MRMSLFFISFSFLTAIAVSCWHTSANNQLCAPLLLTFGFAKASRISFIFACWSGCSPSINSRRNDSCSSRRYLRLMYHPSATRMPPAVSLHGKDRCRTCELFDIAYCGSAADSEFGSQLAVCSEAMIAEIFQHLLPSLKRAAHVLHLLSALLG